MGNGTQTPSATPVPVTGLTNVVAVSAGYFYDLALKADGSVWAWGSGGFGVLGQADQDQNSHLTPVQVAGLSSGVVAISAGDYTALALKSDGLVLGWGRGDFGQLGQSVSQYAFVPTPVTGLSSNVAAVAAGDTQTLALRNDGSVVALGLNAAGELGDGTTIERNTPVAVSGLSSGVTQIVAGHITSYAVKSDGSVWAWGFNQNGQVGDGTATDRHVPVAVSTLSSGVTKIIGGDTQALAIKADGTLAEWGYANAGDGTQDVFHFTPVLVPGLTGVTAAAGGVYISFAVVGTFHQDATPPTVTLVEPAAHQSFALGAFELVGFACQDDWAMQSCVGSVANGSLIDTSTVRSGSVTVTATNQFGHVTTVTHDYTVDDTTRPTVTIASPADGAAVRVGESVTANYSCSDNLAVATCIGDVANGAAIDTSTPGSHSFSVTVTDQAGNSTTVTYSYTVDSTDPTVTIARPVGGCDLRGRPVGDRELRVCGRGGWFRSRVVCGHGRRREPDRHVPRVRTRSRSPRRTISGNTTTVNRSYDVRRACSTTLRRRS